MTLTLITPPSSQVVTKEEMKQHLRIMDFDEDAVISGLIAAATAHLDGWRGILGRAIMPQTWRVDALAGDVILPMPDVTTASANYGAGAVALTTTPTDLGPLVTLTADGTVDFTCAMPSQLLPAAKVAVQLLAAHWYWNREAVGSGQAEMPLAVSSLAEQLRWGRL